jgi:hypothetical protein
MDVLGAPMGVHGFWRLSFHKFQKLHEADAVDPGLSEQGKTPG